MDTETMIRELESVEEKHKHDKVFTGQINIAAMAHDVKKRIEELKPYEDTGLTPEQIRELKGPIEKLQKHFGDTITVGQVIDFFVDFYVAQGDPSRVEEAELLTNEEVELYKELKERDTAKEPEGFDGHWFKCPRCGKYVGGLKGNFCHVCGQRLKWEE